jgi:hypothetical protein
LGTCSQLYGEVASPQCNVFWTDISVRYFTGVVFLTFMVDGG